ncbi:hypothetical protein [Candidatus Viridilinea mediisalina]|uniref:Uncharacterized protein n=1 Tax=Candidatus Viridilinea mediisalina TaxID=2024553 RepID=A0A2A6RKI9_9CHLR|nr:hypothetical protein [Candidatus Viridilinea mediisalina]PDW03542.1 hypothetical protein CJ255_08225 [Candidatus Viridilinea mediisalina]
MKHLPIRRIAFTTPQAVRATLADEARAYYAAERHAELLAFVAARLEAIPEESDVVHDLLAHLAEQMIALHQGRQAALEAFLLDLEGVLPAGQLAQLGRLYTPPRPPAQTADATKQAAYHAALTDAQAVLGAMATQRIELRAAVGLLNEAQWKWLLKARLKQKVGSMAELVHVFRTRQPAIAKLDARITTTDHLIDQVVYQLYGLTPEEVALMLCEDTATSK